MKDVLGTWLPTFNLPTPTEDLALLSGKLQIIFSKDLALFKWWNITDLFWKCTIFWQTIFSPDELLFYYWLLSIFFLKLINFTAHFRLLISTLHNWYHHILQNAGKLLIIFSETYSFKWWNITDLFWKCTIFWQTTFSPDELLSYYLLFQYLPRINQFFCTFLGSYPLLSRTITIIVYQIQVNYWLFL